MASFGFVSLAVVGYLSNPVDMYYFCIVCFASLFGFCGDILLGIKEIAPTFKSKLIPLGTLYFLVAHIFCLCAFISRGGFNAVALIIAFFGGIFAIVMIKALKMKVNKKLLFIMPIYYAALVYKVTSSAVLLLADNCIAYQLALASSVLFLISDSCLTLLYFTPVKKKNVWVTVELSTYYAAQILIAMSVALIK